MLRSIVLFCLTAFALSDQLDIPCRSGECVPYYLCSNGSNIFDSTGSINVRLGEESVQTEDHPCKGLLQTCCTDRLSEPKIPKVEIHNGCGYRNVDGVGFTISTHNEAQFGEFPWTVAVIKKVRSLENIIDAYVCSGSLIHPSVVLTAAHCVSGQEATTLKIRAGEWDPRTTDEIFPHQDRTVSDLVVHEQYTKVRFLNDVALLFLSEPVAIAENVNTVCLPPKDQVFENSRCIVAGWDKDLFSDEGKSLVILKAFELPIVPHDSCEQTLRQTRLGTRFALNMNSLCAGGVSGEVTCKGDVGSALMCPITGTKDRFYQAGIVSWNVGCTDNKPVVFANVPLFREWIDGKLQEKQLSTTDYVLA